jgi:hypothetical protein
VYAQIEEVIKRNKDKHILIVTHHPLFSDGIHGGYFTFADHVFPLSIVQKYAFLPLPIIGSIYPLARKYGGISQDIPHPAYQAYKKNLLDIFAKYPNVIYANGHEHNLQYTDVGTGHFITSGSGCKTQHVKPGVQGDALFSDKEKGFARLNYYEDGQVWVEFLVPNDADQGKTARRVYRQQVYANLGRGTAMASTKGPGGAVNTLKPDAGAVQGTSAPASTGRTRKGNQRRPRSSGRPGQWPARRRARSDFYQQAPRLPRQHRNGGREPYLCRARPVSQLAAGRPLPCRVGHAREVSGARHQDG